VPNGLRYPLWGCGAGVDSVWEQEKLQATLCEMLDAKRAADLQHPVHAGLARF